MDTRSCVTTRLDIGLDCFANYLWACHLVFGYFTSRQQSVPTRQCRYKWDDCRSLVREFLRLISPLWRRTARQRQHWWSDHERWMETAYYQSLFVSGAWTLNRSCGVRYSCLIAETRSGGVENPGMWARESLELGK